MVLYVLVFVVLVVLEVDTLSKPILNDVLSAAVIWKNPKRSKTAVFSR